VGSLAVCTPLAANGGVKQGMLPGAQVLDEIQAGMFDGMTYAQIEQTMPEEFAARKSDKLGYR
jgi:broad specificity phosphatase PhoE